MMSINRNTSAGIDPAQKENPTSVATLAGASKFQQSKTILPLIRRTVSAIVFTKTISVFDLAAMAGGAVVVVMLGAWK